MEFIALNHGNFHLANTDIRECIIFTEFLRKTRRNNGNIRIKIFYREEELENFDKLNKTFNERINQLNVNESTKGPSDDKALELENDNLNENKKRVVTSQGGRDDSECA
ncbi:hypothetical protein RhiirC2_787553 [Rhizophagus irregularis]|uniref:Uncharacterized protein n=1 Tax=Rhizophagus irregularis TaxID=588596 RepID=A0A2N1MRW2_9GLOM|nr:hypothetical protein RhiirC2_787553 [Rhizophagus irregularis]